MKSVETRRELPDIKVTLPRDFNLHNAVRILYAKFLKTELDATGKQLQEVIEQYKSPVIELAITDGKNQYENLMTMHNLSRGNISRAQIQGYEPQTKLEDLLPSQEEDVSVTMKELTFY